MAATGPSAQTPPGQQQPVAQLPPAAQTPQAPSGEEVLHLPATVCNQQVPEPSKQPPVGSPTILYGFMLCFEKQGGFPVIEAQTYLYYIQTRPSDSRVDAGCPYDDKPNRRSSAISSGCGRPTSSTTWSIDVRDCSIRQRRDGQAGRLQHGGAPAGQDRRLRRHAKSRAVEDRREVEEAGHPDPARLLHRSRDCCAASPASSARCTPRRATVRRGQARGQGESRAGQDRQRDVQHRRRARRSRSAKSTSSATRRSATASSRAR